MNTIYMPNFMQPYQKSIDMGINQTFSAKVNGNQIDAYTLVIKKLDNTIVYTSGKITLAQKLYNKQALNVTMNSGIVSYRGQLKWILTYFNGTESVSSGEMIFTNMTTPTITSTIPSIVPTRFYSLEGTYSQLENIPIKRWNAELFDSNGNSLQSSGDIYSSQIKYGLEGLAKNTSYYVVMTIETQSMTGMGMSINLTKTFSVQYAPLTLDFHPSLTQLDDKSAIKVDWSALSQNGGVITGGSAYVDRYLKEDNIGLSLDSNSNLKYDDFIIPSMFTMSFMQQLPKGFNGIIFTTKDGGYQLGYSSVQPTLQSSITYAGTWASEVASDSHSGSTRSSNITNNNATFSYSGTGLKLCLIQSAHMGMAEITVDGEVKGIVNLYKGATDNSVESVTINGMFLQEHVDFKNWNDVSTKTFNDISTLNIEDLVFKYMTIDTSDYVYNAHTIKINVKGTKDALSDNTQVNLKSIEVLNGSSDNKFYSIIQGNKVFSQKIMITDNPFIFTLLPTEVKIKTYNIYETLNSMGSYSWNDLKDFNGDFLGQVNR